MSKRIVPFQTLTARDMFDSYAEELLKNNKEYVGKYAYGYKNSLILRPHPVKPDKFIVVADFKVFKKILCAYNKKAGEYLIRGYRINLYNNMGYLSVKLVERNPNNQRLNKGASFKRRKELKEAGTLTATNWQVYFTDDHYIIADWAKRGAILNESVYKFVAAGGQQGKGFRQKLSQAVKNDPSLLSRYEFVPLKVIN